MSENKIRESELIVKRQLKIAQQRSMTSDQNIILNLQESFGELNYFIEGIIDDIDQMNYLIDEHLLNPKHEYTDMVISDKEHIKKYRIHENPQTYFPSTQKIPAHYQNLADDSKSNLEDPFLNEQESVKQEKFTHSPLTNSQKRNKVVNFLSERRYVEAFFKTKFHDSFELSDRKDSKVLKLTFRNIFIRWLRDKNLLPEKLKLLNSDDTMLIQRLLTLYIKDNFSGKCSFQGKHYNGMIFKFPNKLLEGKGKNN